MVGWIDGFGMMWILHFWGQPQTCGVLPTQTCSTFGHPITDLLQIIMSLIYPNVRSLVSCTEQKTRWHGAACWHCLTWISFLSFFNVMCEDFKCWNKKPFNLFNSHCSERDCTYSLSRSPIFIDPSFKICHDVCMGIWWQHYCGKRKTSFQIILIKEKKKGS